MAPVPANKSRTFEETTFSIPNIEKIADRTRVDVGRRSLDLSIFNDLPLCVPPDILVVIDIATKLLFHKYFRNASTVFEFGESKNTTYFLEKFRICTNITF